MSFTTISRSNSSPIIRVFSKQRFRGTDPTNFDSGTSLIKSSCGGSESDGEYETSSEGHLHPAPETRPSLCRTRKSGPAMVDDDTSCKTEVSMELKLEGVGSTKTNNKNSAEDFVGRSKDLTSPQPELAKVSVHSTEKRGKLVPSLLESRFSSETDRSAWCFLSDSRQTLQSMGTKSNLALSTAKTSSIDVQSVYKKKKFLLDPYSHSVETDSVYKAEHGRFQFSEKHRFTDGGKMEFPKSTQAPIDIETNPDPPIHASPENTNVNYELKKNLIKRSHIMSQIEKELAPLRDKINQIFNQVRVDLKGMPPDICNYDNLLEISKSDYFSKENSSLEDNPLSCHKKIGTSMVGNSYSFLPSLPNTPSTEYKLDSNNSYRIKKNYVPETLSSQERFRFNDLSYHPFKCTNRPRTFSCFHKEHSPRHFENCRYAFLNNEIITLETAPQQDFFASNSSYSLRGHRVSHVEDNSRHISLNDFPVVRQHFHSFHANVLPVNSENLHQHHRSKVETSDPKAHMESKIVSNRNNVEHVEKKKLISRSRHQNSAVKKDHVKRCKKHESNESSSSSRPRPFSGRRRCKCKRHRHDLCHQIDRNLSPADAIAKDETLSRVEEPSQLFMKLNSSSENTIKSEINSPLKNSVLLKCSSTDEKVESELQGFSNPVAVNVLETEESSLPRKISDPDQKKSSSILSNFRHNSKPYSEHKEPIKITEHNASYDKACNTECVDEPAYQKINLLHSEIPALNTPTEMMKKSQTEILKTGISNFNQPLRVDAPKERITITSLQSQVSEKGSRKSISNQHSKMSLPKTHERITIVPIIFSSGMPEPLNENSDFASSEKNAHKKKIPPNAVSQERSSSGSDFSLSSHIESSATGITHLATKCAFIDDSKGRLNSRMTLNTASSSYSFMKPLGSQIRVERRTKANNESRTRKTSSRSSTSYKTSENPMRNSVVVRRIRGIRTSPEDFMYE